MLTSKQRAYLRKLSNPLAVTLHIGKDGVTDGVISQLEVLLENHELVKGKVLENAMLTPKTVSEALCEPTVYSASAPSLYCTASPPIRTSARSYWRSKR